MAKLPKRASARIVVGLKRFQPILTSAQSRDVNESNTVVIMTDLLDVIPYKPRQWAEPFHASRARWLCLVLHRRAGKTTAVINHHQRAAVDDTWEAQRLRHLVPSVTEAQVTDLLRQRFYGHVLPTYKQAKLTTWEMLKYFATPIPGVTFNESELCTSGRGTVASRRVPHRCVR